MRAFLSVRFHDDPGNRAHVEALATAIEQAGCESICIVRDVEEWGRVTVAPRDLMRRTCAEIADCQLLVADIAETGVGPGVEAGYAHAQGIPVITVAPVSTDVPAALAGISFRVFRYTEPADLVAPLQELARALSALAGSVDAGRTASPHRHPSGGELA
jgi:hypothetical protein